MLVWSRALVSIFGSRSAMKSFVPLMLTMGNLPVKHGT